MCTLMDYNVCEEAFMTDEDCKIQESFSKLSQQYQEAAKDVERHRARFKAAMARRQNLTSKLRAVRKEWKKVSSDVDARIIEWGLCKELATDNESGATSD